MQFIDKLFQHYLNYQVETWNLDSVPFVHSLRQYTHQLLVDILKRTNLKKKKANCYQSYTTTIATSRIAYHKCVIHVRESVNKCYIHLFIMHMLQGV